MPSVSWHLYLGWKGHSKSRCTGQCTHFTTPMLWACKLQNEERWGWSNHAQSYLLGLTGVISNSATRMPMLTSTHLLSPYIRLFTLYLSRKLWEMSKWMHRVSYSPTLEDSYMCNAGLVKDNSYFVALPQSHSYEFVPLGWWWFTWPSWPAQPYSNESPLLE